MSRFVNSSDEENDLAPSNGRAVQRAAYARRAMEGLAPFSFHPSNDGTAPYYPIVNRSSIVPEEAQSVSTVDRKLGSSNANSKSSTFTKDLKETIKCGICFEVYGKERMPKNLECGHCFCEKCLFEIWKNCSVRCPNCRQETSAGWRRSFGQHPYLTLATNYVALNVAEKLTEANSKTAEASSRACETCETVSTRLWVCKTCLSRELESADFCSDCILEYHEGHEKERVDFQLIKAKESAKQRSIQKLHDNLRDLKGKIRLVICDLQAIENPATTSTLPSKYSIKLRSILESIDQAHSVETCQSVEDDLQDRLDALNQAVNEFL